MYSKSGVQAYQQVGLESAVLSASPHQLVVMLFDGIHSALIRARLFLEQGDIPAKGEALSKAINIIENGLKAGLNMDVGGELPAIFLHFTTIWYAVCYMPTCAMTSRPLPKSRLCCSIFPTPGSKSARVILPSRINCNERLQLIPKKWHALNALSNTMLGLAQSGKWDELIDREVAYVSLVEEISTTPFPPNSKSVQDRAMVILNQVLQNEIILKELLQERMSELSGLIAQTNKQKRKRHLR